MSGHCRYFSLCSREVLQEEVLNIFDKIGCGVSSDHIESCHRISKRSDIVIVTFSRRKGYQQVWQVKNQRIRSKNLPLNYLQTEACVHTTRYYGQRTRNCITLVKLIVFFISGDTVKIKIN